METGPGKESVESRKPAFVIWPTADNVNEEGCGFVKFVEVSVRTDEFMAPCAMALMLYYIFVTKIEGNV
jgi:hypothetical protein